MASEVQQIELSFVAPSTETPRNGLWVSSLDLERWGQHYTPIVYLYRHSSDPSENFSDVSSRLKESMAKALVAFYPLAGRIGVDNNGRIEINCNCEGALFVVARADKLTVDDFKDMKPSAELRRLFVPHVEPPSVLLGVQVTFLKCGGVVIGTALHHGAGDGASAFRFIQTWSAISRDGNGAAVKNLPCCHDRTLLRARSPPAVHPNALSVLYCPKAVSSAETEPDSAAPTTADGFTVSKDQLASLKRVCGGASAFCALSALVWQCTFAARPLRPDPDAQARISFTANARRRSALVPERYFGNAILTLYASGAARDVASEPLEHVAGRIRATIEQVDDELVRSAVDYYHELLEMGYKLKGGIMAETEMRVVSWLGMPMYDADFGWGKPWWVSRAGSAHGHARYVHLMDAGPEPDRESGIRVIACMEAAYMEEFKRLLYAKLDDLASSDLPAWCVKADPPLQIKL